MDKRILNSCKFILDTVFLNTEYGLVYSNLFLTASRVTGIIVNGAQPIRVLLSLLPFSLFLGRGKGKRERERGGEREKQLLLHTTIFFFLSKVYCHVIPHRVLFSPRSWRELCKNLTVLSSPGAYTKNQIQSKELTSLRQVRILNKSEPAFKEYI